MALRVLAFARLRELLGFGERTLEVGASPLGGFYVGVTPSGPAASTTRFARNGVIVDGR